MNLFCFEISLFNRDLYVLPQLVIPSGTTPVKIDSLKICAKGLAVAVSLCTNLTIIRFLIFVVSGSR